MFQKKKVFFGLILKKHSIPLMRENSLSDLKPMPQEQISASRVEQLRRLYEGTLQSFLEAE